MSLVCSAPQPGMCHRSVADTSRQRKRKLAVRPSTRPNMQDMLRERGVCVRHKPVGNRRYEHLREQQRLDGQHPRYISWQIRGRVDSRGDAWWRVRLRRDCGRPSARSCCRCASSDGMNTATVLCRPQGAGRAYVRLVIRWCAVCWYSQCSVQLARATDRQPRRDASCRRGALSSCICEDRLIW